MKKDKKQEIEDWFETFLKVVCWEYHLEPNVPYHDLANHIVDHLSTERKGIVDEILPWRKQGKRDPDVQEHQRMKEVLKKHQEISKKRFGLGIK